MRVLLLVLLAAVTAMPVAAQEATYEMQDTANYYGETAMDLLRDGDFNSGLRYLEKATQANPYDPNWRMQYTQILTKQAAATMRDGSKTMARRMFKKVEDELLKAASLYIRKGANNSAANIFNQVGDINLNIFMKRRTAAAYYQKALQYNPKHPQAKSSLGRLLG